MLKILATCSRLSLLTLRLPARRLELAVAARSRFVVVFNWMHTTNSHNLSDKQENQDALENGKRKRDNSNSFR